MSVVVAYESTLEQTDYWLLIGLKKLSDNGRPMINENIKRTLNVTENLLFVESVWHMKKMAEKDVAAECHRIWNRYT